MPAIRPSAPPCTRRQGADEIVILDVSATPEARGNQVETVQRVRARLRIPLTVGGGIRTIDDARALLEAGADKVSINTAAVHRPELLSEIAERFGRQCTVLAIDAARREGGFEVLVKGGREGTGVDAVEWARAGTGRGAGEILLTSWDRDGTRAGYDLELTRAVAAAVRVPVIASGGAATPAAPEGGVRCRRRRGARRLDLPRRRHDGRRGQARARGARRARAAMIAQHRAGRFVIPGRAARVPGAGRALVVLVVRRVDQRIWVQLEPGSSPPLSALTLCSPVAPTMSGIRWSMGSWESVRPRRNRRQGVPRSHGPAEESANGIRVNVQLIAPMPDHFTRGPGAQPHQFTAQPAAGGFDHRNYGNQLRRLRNETPP